MDAVKFIEERNRMCGTMSEVWGVDAAQIVKNTEEWSAAHPRKTRQSVFLEQYPEARIGNHGVLLDKCGFHVREETADEHDTRSLEYLQQCLVELVEAKNNGYIKMADIEKALRGEYKMVNIAE